MKIASDLSRIGTGIVYGWHAEGHAKKPMVHLHLIITQYQTFPLGY